MSKATEAEGQRLTGKRAAAEAARRRSARGGQRQWAEAAGSGQRLGQRQGSQAAAKGRGKNHKALLDSTIC